MKLSKLVLLTFLLGPSVHGAPEVVDAAKLSRELPALNVFDLDPEKPLPRKGGLLELKWRELRKEWPACLALAAKLQPAAKEIEGWVARTRLECAWGAYNERKNFAALAKAFDAVKPSLLREGPWQESLRDVWYRAGLELATRAVKGKATEAARRAEALLDQGDLLSKEQRAMTAAVLAEVSLARKDDTQALFFLRQSEGLAGSSSIRARILEIETRRGDGLREESVSVEPASSVGAEAESEVAVKKAFDEGRRAEAVRLMVQILNRFPNGRLAKSYHQRVAETLLVSADRDAKDGDAAAVRSAAFEADPSRVADWAGLLHRRSEDRGSLELAAKALESLGTSARASSLHWMAGRSALFLGEFDRASMHFDQVVQFHGASDEADESLFRLALLQVREGRFAAAARLFERLIATESTRWDLGARYWRIRAMEKFDAGKAAVERDALIKRYPFTYYGLRLKAERDNGILEFPKSDRSPLEASDAKLWLAGAQKKTWQRFRKLSAEGWLLEAQAELATLPMPQDPWALMQWARTLSRAGQYPAAILLVNKATEGDETLRHPHYLTEAFPRAYGRWIEREAMSHALDPALIRSLVRQESAFGLKAVSTSNAMGLMQMIPPTAREIAGELKMKVAIPDDMFRPEVNVPMGTYYLAKMLRQFDGTVPLALAAYNAGPHRVSKWIRQRPDLAALKGKAFESWQDEMWFDELPWSETSFYVKAILRNALIDRLIDQGRVSVTPAFWADLRQAGGPQTENEVKRR